MHRALVHFRLGTMNLITASCLFVFFSLAWLALLPRVCRIWTHFFTFGIRSLPLRAELGRRSIIGRPFSASIFPTCGWSLYRERPSVVAQLCRHTADFRGHLLYF